MNALDFSAALAAGAASLAMALRSIMLKPNMPTWCDAPPIVRLGIVLASAVWAGVAIDVVRAGHANPREVVAFGTIALSAAALLTNLWRQDCNRGARRHD